VPTSASLLGQHLCHPIAVILYGVNLMAVNAVGTPLWLYAGSYTDLMAKGLSKAPVRFVAQLHSAPILVYAIGLCSRPDVSSPALRYSLSSRRFLFCLVRFLTDA